jgi:thiosulfate/3-mercaptopyruvate sulfurtransferase
LIGVEELGERATGASLRICELRWSPAPPPPRERYLAGHLPGACFVDLDTDLSRAQARGPGGRHPLPEVAAFAQLLSRLGVGPETEVVVYDDGPATVAARLWFLLRLHGHARVRVLDGGLQAWVSSGRPLSREEPSIPPAPLRALGRRSDLLVDRARIAELVAARGRPGQPLLADVRAPERYRGEAEPLDPVAGHIPGAVSLPAQRLVRSASDPRLLLAPELRAVLARAGADGSREVIASCGSGVTACQLLLALEVASLPPGRLYAGSYSDWLSVEGAPVATGHAPG